MSMGRLLTVVCALGAALAVAPASAQDTIKIGVSQPLTGAFAASGNYVAQGAKIIFPMSFGYQEWRPSHPQASRRRTI